MSTRVLILDAFGYWHIGNGALLEDSIKLLFGAKKNIEITILSTDPQGIKEQFPQVHGTLFETLGDKKGLQKWILYLSYVVFCFLHLINEFSFKINPRYLCFSRRQRNAINEILSCDVAISITGEAINDHFWKSLLLCLFTYWFAIHHKKRFILFPQTIVPLNRKWLQHLVYSALKNADLLIARDQASFDKLLELGFDSKKIRFSIDVAVLHSPSDNPITIADYFSLVPAEKSFVYLGLTVSQFLSEVGFEQDIKKILLSAISSTLPKEKYRILLMPSNYLPNGISADYHECLEMKKMLDDSGYQTAILENKMHYTSDYVKLLTELNLFISTRMHVMILATAQGIPTLAISSQFKLKNYMKNLKLDHFALLPSELNHLTERLQNLIDNHDEIQEQLKKEIKTLKEKTLYPCQKDIAQILDQSK